MNKPFSRPVQHHGQKAVSREYKRAMAFMRETMTREKPLTDEEREELIRKAGR